MQDFVFEQISARIDRVREAVPATRLSPDPEAIHGLRVSIRRLTEAIRSLEEWVKPRQAEKLRERLSPAMRAAGETRNLDIARDLCLASPVAAAAGVAERLTAQRTSAAHKLIGKLLAINLDKIQAPCEPDPHLPAPRLLAAGILAQSIPRYWDSGDIAARSEADWADLHRFRLATKQLRYTIELFAPTFGRGATAKLAMLKRVQTHLGNVNDCETARGLGAIRGELELVAWLEERQRGERKKFVEEWMRERQAGNASGRWVRYFTRPR